MTIIEQIKAEIERLKAKYRKDMYKSSHEGLASGYKIEAYNELLSFLDTLESEKPIPNDLEEAKTIFSQKAFEQYDHEQFINACEEPVSDDLEEAADSHIRKVVSAAGHPGWDWETRDIKDAFIDGAKWQEEKDQETIKLAEDHAFLAGAVNEREKMMKEAVDADVMLTLHDKTGDISLHTGYLPKELGIKCDDKVRIIIVKED